MRLKSKEFGEIFTDFSENEIVKIVKYNDEKLILFNEKLLGDRKLSTFARQAQNQAEMRREIAKNKNALGLISRAQADETLHILYSVEISPVFAISKENPTGNIFSVLSCLQGN